MDTDKLKAKIRHCSITPKYPIKAFMVYYQITDERNVNIYYPNTQIYTSIDQIKKDAELLQESIISQNQLNLNPYGLAVPLNLQRLYRLEVRFWHKPVVHFEHFQRMDMFLKAMENITMYNLVVTPLRIGKNKIFVSAIPLLASKKDRDLEQFMLYSDFPVDETAKYAAIYTCGSPFRLNLKNGDISPTISDKIPKSIN